MINLIYTAVAETLVPEKITSTSDAENFCTCIGAEIGGRGALAPLTFHRGGQSPPPHFLREYVFDLLFITIPFSPSYSAPPPTFSLSDIYAVDG